jgi:hypothetical protein
MRPKKTKNFDDLGYVQKESKPRGRPPNAANAIRDAMAKCEKLIF